MPSGVGGKPAPLLRITALQEKRCPPPPESWHCPRAGSCGPPACSGTRPPRQPRAPGTWRPPCSISSWCVSPPCSGARSAADQGTSGNSWQFWGQIKNVSRTAGSGHCFSAVGGHFLPRQESLPRPALSTPVQKMREKANMSVVFHPQVGCTGPREIAFTSSFMGKKKAQSNEVCLNGSLAIFFVFLPFSQNNNNKTEVRPVYDSTSESIFFSK